MLSSLANRLSAAWSFPLRHPAAVFAPAAVYAVLHAVEDFVAGAGAARQGAALVVAFAGLAVIVLAVTAWLRAAFGAPRAAGPAGLALDRTTVQVAIALVLAALLAVTTAAIGFFGVLLLVGGMTIAARDRAGLLAQDAPNELVNVFEYFNLFERAVSLGAMALWLVVSLWLAARLTPALPATFADGRVRVLSIWPASRGRAPGIVLASLLAALPGGLPVWAFGLLAPAAGPVLSGALQAFAGVALIAAPLIALWSADHLEWMQRQDADASPGT